MPELPDVEVYKRYLDSTSLHKTIQDVEVDDRRVLHNISEEKLRQTLKGKKMTRTFRRGKYLLVNLDQRLWLTLHFGMTGRLKYFKSKEKDPAHDRVLFTFTNGYHLAYVSQRMLGEVGIIKDINNFIQDKELGPDALDIKWENFKNLYEGKRRSIKSALMDQKSMAGIGNIYADEILFQSRIHPKTKVEHLDEKKLKKIYQQMGKVLKTAVKERVDPERLPRSYLLTHRDKDGRCPRSHGKLKTTKVSGRTAYFCPRCQKLG
jgi:formamidopyrimidine-DNA glycosylase